MVTLRTEGDLGVSSFANVVHGSPARLHGLRGSAPRISAASTVRRVTRAITSGGPRLANGKSDMTGSRHIVLGLLLAGCGSSSTSPAAHPHARSAIAHDREAASHEATAVEHRARYEPGIADPCDPRLATCWNAMRTSNERHGPEAEQHARLAAEHRRASAALREAEARACAGLPATDRDMSPFERADAVARVDKIIDRMDGASYVAGVVVTFRAVPGLSEAGLQQMVECHLARNAALGHVVPEMPDCPLVPRGATARMRRSGDGLAVEIRGSELAVAREIVARAERVAARSRMSSP